MKARNTANIGIGVLGLGKRGIFLAKLFAEHPDVRLVGLCDRDPRRNDVARSEIASNVESARDYHDLDQMLAQPDLDAVIVATDDTSHATLGEAVLRANRSLFLEKPMAQSIDDCDRLINAWQAAGDVVFMVGLELRFCSLCEDMAQIIRRGDIGNVRIAYAVDNVSVGGQYFYHNHMRNKSHTKNLLLQKGSHTLDLMNWWIGSRPVRVYAEAGLDVFGGDAPNDKRCRDCEIRHACPYQMPREFTLDYGAVVKARDDLCVYAREIDLEDNSIVLVRYENGAKMTFVECHFTPDYNRHFTLIGDRGRVYGFYNNQKDFRIEVTYRHSQRRDVIYSEPREGSHGGGDPRLRDHFVALVQQGQKACPGILGARDSTAIAAAAEDSVLAHAPASIPPCILHGEPTPSPSSPGFAQYPRH